LFTTTPELLTMISPSGEVELGLGLGTGAGELELGELEVPTGVTADTGSGPVGPSLLHAQKLSAQLAQRTSSTSTTILESRPL
jgi:hypothetical protein